MSAQQNEKVDFSKFGKNFQEKLVHLMFRDRLFCDQMREVMDLNFLETSHLQVFTRKIFEYKDKYQTHPSEQTMATIVRSSLETEDESTQKLVREYFARIVADKEIDCRMETTGANRFGHKTLQSWLHPRHRRQRHLAIHGGWSR